MRNGDYLMVIAPSEYPGKKYRDRYCYEHQYVYWLNTGSVPGSDELIHHKDENKHNNDFSNLELKRRAEHSRLHNLSKGVSYALVECPCCKLVFEREHRHTHLVKKGRYTACSRKCSGVIANDKHNEYSLDGNIIEVYRKTN